MKRVLAVGAQPYLRAALERVAKEGAGVVVVLRETETPRELADAIMGIKAATPAATPAAPVLRTYGIGAQILLDMGVKSIRVLTNNPRKLVGLDGYGLILKDRVRIEAPSTDENASYLETKRTKLGHLFAI